MDLNKLELGQSTTVLVARVGSTVPVQGDSFGISAARSGISADSKKTVVLGKEAAGQIADDILWTASDGSPHILLALQTSIYSDDPGFWPEVRDFDVSTGKGKRVLSPSTNVMDWYADGAGIVQSRHGVLTIRRTSRLLYRRRRRTSLSARSTRSGGRAPRSATCPRCSCRKRARRSPVTMRTDSTPSIISTSRR